MTDALVLDFDGTLYTNEDEAYRRFRETLIEQLQQHGIDDPARTVEAAQERLKNTEQTSTFEVLQDELSSDIGLIHETVHERVCRVMEPSTILASLGRYQETYRTAIFTNNEEQLVHRFLRDHGKTVDTILGAETLSQLKPKPGAFHTFLETVPYQPAEAVFVDNDQQNRNTAASLGFATCRPTTIDEVIG